MKKKRSAKQRANDKRLSRLGGRKRAKVNKRPATKRTMVKRRSSRRSYSKARSYGRKSRKIGGSIVSTVKPFASGIGGGLVTETAVSTVAPQFGQIAGYGGAWLFGGVKGLIGKIGFDVLTGKGLGLGGLGIGGTKQVEVSV